MSFGRIAWTTLSVGSIVITVFTLYNIIAGRWLFPPGDIVPTSGDDDPIIVSGGSLDITSTVGFQQYDNVPYQANHLHTRRKLVSVDVRYGAGAAQFDTIYANSINGPIDITVNYCQDMPCTNTSPQEQVIFRVNGGHNNLFISNQGGPSGIGTEADGGKRNIHHMPDTWHVIRIDVAPISRSYQCVGGICGMVLHYYCGNSGHCQ
jgi:hypothetical protein